ncbi:RTA1-domain-containing protein [Meredithblackwellia eburnea MCA 4105]
MDGDELTFNIYGYNPSEGAAIAFIVLFAILSVAQLGILLRSRVSAWWISAVLLVGGITEILGWAGRLWSSKNVYSLNAFLVQQICLILAPCFFSAMVYGTLGMLIRKLGPQFSRLRPNWYLLVFCIADLLAIVIQAIGGAQAAIALQDSKDSDTGTHIMVAGIVVQLVGMLVFCFLGGEFFLKARKAPQSTVDRRVNLLVFGLAFASFWILVRCIYRVIELAEGWTGYLITHQPYFLALDSVPMVLAMGVFVPCHPYFCLPEYTTSTFTSSTTQHSDLEKAAEKEFTSSLPAEGTLKLHASPHSSRPLSLSDAATLAEETNEEKSEMLKKGEVDSASRDLSTSRHESPSV